MMALWKSYLIPWSSAPVIGEIDESTALVAHAFGRNDFPDDEAYPAITKMREESSSIEDVFVLMRQRHFDIGKPNISLVRECISFIKRYGIKTCILQWELSYGLWLFLDDDLYRSMDICTIWPEPEYLAARGFSIRVAQTCERYQIRKIVSVAHRAMASRAALVFRRICRDRGFEISISIPLASISDQFNRGREVPCVGLQEKSLFVYTTSSKGGCKL
jgi:hypothetical protein